MANKRQLKKAIRYACGDMAGECYFAATTFENADIDRWEDIVIDIAMLQAKATNRISVAFDKVPRDYDSKRQYKKERRAFYKAVKNSIAGLMKEESQNIVARMNELAKQK